MERDAIVLGAGIIGLTSAIGLAEDGWRVRVVADRDPLDTTSAVAAAIWLPYRAAPVDRVFAWAHATYDVLARQATDPARGVRLSYGRLLWHTAPDAVLERLPAGAPPEPIRDLPSGFAGGVRFQVPVIEMPVYLRWLEARLRALGVTVERRRMMSLDDLAGEAPIVVNATGLYARELVPDDSVFPIRGQIVRLENPGIEQFTLDEDDGDDVRYVIPRSRDVIVGGTAVEHVWDVTPSLETRERILRRAVEIEPRLAHARVIEDRVGLRPGRPAVRLEAEPLGDSTAIHNYGHGGSGVTVSWGCAANVVALAREHATGEHAGRAQPTAIH